MVIKDKGYFHTMNLRYIRMILHYVMMVLRYGTCMMTDDNMRCWTIDDGLYVTIFGGY